MNSYEYNINHLLSQLELYSETDLDKFEAIRSEIIKTAIESYPEEFQKRAYGIQFALDCDLRKYKHPVARMNRMTELFWGKVHELNLALNNPAALMRAREEKREPAKVIPLFTREPAMAPPSAAREKL